MVQRLMRNSGYRKIDTLLPTREGLGNNWLEIQKNLRKVNRYRVEMVEEVRGRRKLIAYSDGSGRNLCQCINLGNTIGQGDGGQRVEVSNKVVVTCGCGRVKMEKRFGIGGFFGKRNEDGNLAELNFAIRSNQVGQQAPSNNCAELEAIERIIEIGMIHEISELEIRTDSEFCIKTLRKIGKWKRQKWVNRKGTPIKCALQYSNILNMINSSNMRVTLHKVKAHVGIEGNWWADELAKIGCQGKGKDIELRLPETKRNLAIRFLWVELESIEPGGGGKWLGRLRRDAAHDIGEFKKLFVESGKGDGDLPGWRKPEATMIE